MKTHIETILVLEDIADKKYSAVEQAAIIAEKVSGKLEIGICEYGKGSDLKGTKSIKGLEKKVKKFGVEYEILNDSPCKGGEIIKSIKKQDPSLIVMNTSFVEVVKYSPVRDIMEIIDIPLLVVKRNEVIYDLQSIILPLDLTTETTDKVKSAVDLALLFNSTVHVISFLQDSDDFLTNKLSKQLEMVKDFMLEDQVKCTTELIRVIQQEGGLAESIVDHADKQQANLIMVMARDVSSDGGEEIVSQEAMEVIQGAGMAVLAVPPRPSERISLG